MYTADQNVKNNKGATATRQNPNGDRSGQECAEERDYYPYWHPAGWKDVAIMTNDLARCEVYKLESQNVKAKNYCSNPKKVGRNHPTPHPRSYPHRRPHRRPHRHPSPPPLTTTLTATAPSPAPPVPTPPPPTQLQPQLNPNPNPSP